MLNFSKTLELPVSVFSKRLSKTPYIIFDTLQKNILTDQNAVPPPSNHHPLLPFFHPFHDNQKLVFVMGFSFLQAIHPPSRQTIPPPPPTTSLPNIPSFWAFLKNLLDYGPACMHTIHIFAWSCTEYARTCWKVTPGKPKLLDFKCFRCSGFSIDKLEFYFNFSEILKPINLLVL